MTKPLLFSLAVAVAAGAGCECHPASQTVPGFDQKQAEKRALQEKEARTPISINPDAPKYFPPQK